MPFRPHSGIVILVCPDPAYHSHWADLLTGGSRFEQAVDTLTQYITSQEGNTDPAALLSYAQVVQELRAGKPTSRMAQLIQLAFDHPDNPDKRIPHILRVEGPASLLGDSSRRISLLADHRNVFSGAHTVLAEGHSDCMGVAKRHEGQYRNDQRQLQTELITAGAQPFVNHLAVEAERNVTFRAMYTQFGPDGAALETVDLTTVRALAPAA